MAIMPPTVVTALLDGSGPNMPPRAAQLGIEPLVDHARLHADRFALDADIRRMCLEKSSTSPGPSDSPATPLPAPRAWTGMCFSAAYWTQATTSAVERGRTTASGRIS